METSDRDELFERPDLRHRPFTFDAEVARVFPDMIQRSVPGYVELVRLTGLIASRVVRPGTRCYDLGCSLGAVSREILLRTPPTVPVIAVDTSAAMIAGLRARLADTPGRERLEPLQADLATIEITQASLIVLNFTLQFIPLARRDELLQQLRAGLVPKGALVLAEKIELGEGAEGRFVRALHDDFKRANGYSDLAIARKRAALEQVLVPETVEQHERRLAAAGFSGWTRWFQCLDFVAWVAWT
ncbi:carboxy-S-adenosyl-L-methionine synthase CmoA [Thiocapsa imhoffii]|uniref:Carboxy-S-adenosyl-L-methionine synthase n=1 Tax=Thiocapsa imhoffii TaxID=382777 RepID=A0A9X0WK97_9GAMM|nr:carboxy-S-adenosyl-L-methionine synthase CmoA [Thiocapsa imhoffii]MBK1646020.1 carboxy-S-adenosyl-L-methionine synthase CmoA [Thiocapsa imhoffii]